MEEKCMKKKIILKQFISVLITVAVLFYLSFSFAAPANAVTPRWASILSMDLSMTFDGNEGSVTGAAMKQSTATKIEGTVYLYELDGDDWIYIDEWYNSKTRGTLGVGGDFTCESGVTYKAVFVVTAYTGTTPETETMEYIDVCP